MRIAIMGAGGQGRTVEDCLRSNGVWRYTFIDDADLPRGSDRLKDAGFLKRHTVIVAVGDNSDRRRLSEIVLAHGGRLATVLHAMSHVSDNCAIGDGCSVHFGAHVGSGVVIGRGSIVNNLVSVAHDCLVGDYVNLCDGAVLGGAVWIGSCAFLGLNCTIAPRVRIGAAAIVGAGAVVLNDVASGARVVGNPARYL